MDTPINKNQEKMNKEEQAPGREIPVEKMEAGEIEDVSGAAEIEEAEAKAAERGEFYDKFLRAKADLENYRKRMQREKENIQDFAVIDLARRLLPVLDDLDRALNAARDNRHVKHFLKGIKLIESQLFKVLEDKGVKPIGAVGERFDPSLHEAVMVDTKSDRPDDTVVEELQRGYIYKEKIVRPAKVKVAKKA